VPRPNPPRSLQSEENLARRIAYERDRRGWTYESIAKRLTDVGCPIQGSAIYKIEKGNPRRRISVDEFVAFTRIFEVSAADLLIPLELIAEHEALNLIAELERKYHALSASVVTIARPSRTYSGSLGPTKHMRSASSAPCGTGSLLYLFSITSTRADRVRLPRPAPHPPGWSRPALG
jgi:transcriptional regulator with XRE-family HTH domain